MTTIDEAKKMIREIEPTLNVMNELVNALWRIGQLPAVYLVSKDLEKQTSVLWEQRTQDEEMQHRLRPVIGHFRGLPVVVVSTTSGCLIAVGANGRAEVRHLPVV